MTSFIPSFVEMHRSIAGMTGRNFRLKRPTKQQHPRGVERAFAADLARIIEAVNDDLRERLLPEIARLSRLSGLRADELHSDIEDIEAVIQSIQGPIGIRVNNLHLRNLEQLVQGYFNDTSQFSRLQTFRQIRRVLGVEAFPREDQLQTMLSGFRKENVSLITGMTEAHVTGIMDHVRRSIRAGDRPSVIEGEIRKRFKTTKNRAKLIARDQVNKLNGALTRMRQTNLGINEYIWRTARDERVREKHLSREGKVFSWDDPPDGGHPGQEILCRCQAEPVVEGAPPPKEDRTKVVREVRRKREELREKLRGRKSRRLIAAGPRKIPKPPPAPPLLSEAEVKKLRFTDEQVDMIRAVGGNEEGRVFFGDLSVDRPNVANKKIVNALTEKGVLVGTPGGQSVFTDFGKKTLATLRARPPVPKPKPKPRPKKPAAKPFDKERFELDNAQWAEDLSEEEDEAFSLWANEASRDLRGLDLGRETALPKSELLGPRALISSAMKRAPKFQGKVFRGTSLSDDQLAMMKPGTIYEEGALSSWTTDETLALEFQERASQRGNAIVLRAKARTGVSIKDLPEVFEDEAEVMFEKNTRFRVLSVKGDQIELEEIDG